MEYEDFIPSNPDLSDDVSEINISPIVDLPKKNLINSSNPQISVFLRQLGWESLFNQNITKEILPLLVRESRIELGLVDYEHNGSYANFLQRVRQEGISLSNKTSPEEFAKDLSQEIMASWKHHAWQLLHSPSHYAVRRLSANPIAQKLATNNKENFNSLYLILRDSSVPHIYVAYGEERPKRSFDSGVYFLFLEDRSIYIGATRGWSERASTHYGKKNIVSWIFFSPEVTQNSTVAFPPANKKHHYAFDKQSFGADALSVSEALLISYWNEVCNIANGNRGLKNQPNFSNLQRGASLAKAVSAALIWFIREQNSQKPWCLPFKRVQRLEGWPSVYLEIPE